MGKLIDINLKSQPCNERRLNQNIARGHSLSVMDSNSIEVHDGRIGLLFSNCGWAEFDFRYF